MATENAVLAVIRASRPSFRNRHDKVAFAVHASFLAAGYVLTATGNRAFFDSLPPSGKEEVGFEGWNELEDAYGFIYFKSEKGSIKSIAVKCTAIEDKLLIDVLPLGEEQKEPINLEINVSDYVRDDTASNSYGELYKNIQGLVESINSNIFSKLENLPKGDKASSSCRSETDVRPEHNQNQPDTGILPKHQPYFPSLLDPQVVQPGNNDLDPGLGAGIYPTRGSSGIGGGMLLGPNDPLWRVRFGEQPDVPIPGVPPGARFDPYGPPDVPGFEPNRFIRNQRRPGGGTHPDLEHFSPF